MGSEISSLQANIEITVGEEELVRIGEVLRNTLARNGEQVVGEYTDRQGHAAMQAGGRKAGDVEVVTTAGDAGVTRAGGAGTGGAGGTRAGAAGGQRRDFGGVEALQGCSTDSTGSGKTKNVQFFKAGRCHRLGCNKGHVGRRYNQMSGLITPASTGKRKITETITLAGSNNDSSDEESLEEMEKRLAKMLELKFKRRKGPNSSN